MECHMEPMRIWAGLDTGADRSRLCIIDSDHRSLADLELPSTPTAVLEALKEVGTAEIQEIAMEAGSTSVHLAHALKTAGLPATLYHPTHVSRYLRLRRNKTDQNDALGLAEIAKLQLPSMSRVHLRSTEMQQLRTKLLFRHRLNRQRVAAEGMIRSLIRLHGGKLNLPFKSPSSAQEVTNELMRFSTGHIDLSHEVTPLMELCSTMRRYLHRLDLEIDRLARENPVCSRFLQIPGIGPICALSFYTLIEDPRRFERTSDVGAYLGLTPKVLQSGASLRHRNVTRAGNALTRSHLSCAAASVLAARTRASPLKIWGAQLAKKVGQKKARIAVARRLAVTMLAMWKSGANYEPVLLEPLRTSKEGIAVG